MRQREDVCRIAGLHTHTHTFQTDNYKILAGSVADAATDPYVLGLLDPDPLVRGMDPDPDPSITK